MYHTVPLWVKALASKLYNIDIIENVFIASNRITISYATGYKDHYYFSGYINESYKIICEDDYNFDPDISLRPIFGEHSINENSYDYHIRINKRDIITHNMLSLQVLANKLAKHVYDRRHRFHKYPVTFIEKQIYEFNKYKITSPKCYYMLATKIPKWFNLWLYYFGPSYNIDCIRYYYRAWQLLKIRGSDINTTSLFYLLERDLRGIISIDVYATILQSLNVEHVLDMQPNKGYLALACAKLGINYTSNPNVSFDNALNKNIVNDLDLKYKNYNSNDVYDIVISDGDFKDFDISSVSNYKNQCKRLMTYCPQHKLASYAKYNPKLIDIVFRKPGYFLIWNT